MSPSRSDLSDLSSSSPEGFLPDLRKFSSGPFFSSSFLPIEVVEEGHKEEITFTLRFPQSEEDGAKPACESKEQERGATYEDDHGIVEYREEDRG